MKRLLKAEFYLLRCHHWLLLALLAAVLLIGGLAGAAVLQAEARSAALPAWYRLALVLEGRRALPFAGGVFAAVRLWLGFARNGLDAPLCRGYRRGAVFCSVLLPLLLFLAILSLLSALCGAAVGGVFAVGLPAGYVLRGLLLRLIDDLPLCLVPLCLSFLLRGGYAAPLLAAAWGLLIYFRLPTDFLRWQPGAVWQPVALWPLPAAAVSAALSRVFFRKA